MAWFLGSKRNLREVSRARKLGKLSQFQQVEKVPPLNVREISAAEEEIIKVVQSQSFHEEICILTGLATGPKEDRAGKKTVKRPSSIFKLDPDCTSDPYRSCPLPRYGSIPSCFKKIRLKERPATSYEVGQWWKFYER